ncbi:MAG: coiled-coil domain-containing protein [Methylobacter sp.]
MRTIRLWVKWLWRRAWPVIVILFLGAVHWLLINYFYLNASATNKTISLLSQIVGGLLILYSIDSNIGVIKEKSLFSIFIQVLKDHPRIKRSFFGHPRIGTILTTGGRPKIRVGRNSIGTEEKLDYLQEQISNLKRDFEQELQELNKKIDDQMKEMDAEIQKTNSAIQKIELKVDEVFIGGIKIQIFGVLLMIYGSISGYLVSDNAISTYSYIGCSLHNFTNITSILIKSHCV